MIKLWMFTKGVSAFLMTALLTMPAYADGSDGKQELWVGGTMGAAGVAALGYAVRSPKPSAAMKAEYATMNRQEAMLSGEALEAYRLARGYKWYSKTGHMHYDGFYPKTAEQAEAILQHNPRFYSALAGAALVPGALMVGGVGYMLHDSAKFSENLDKKFKEQPADVNPSDHQGTSTAAAR